MIEWLKRDMLGPREGPKEELAKSENPTQSYLSGILFPRTSGVNLEDYDENGQTELEGGDSDDDPHDERAGLVARLMQSSFGMTCTITSNTARLLVRIEYGTYDIVRKIVRDQNKSINDDSMTHDTEYDNTDESTVDKKASWVYKRSPHSETHDIRLDISEPKEIPLSTNEQFALWYSIKAHARGLSLSLFVVNNHPRSAEDDEFKRCMFQPQITLLSHDGSNVFVDYKAPKLVKDEKVNDHDSGLFDMLFRKKGNFAIGHGCAVKWDAREGADRVAELRTTFIPVHCVPNIRPRPSSARFLNMEILFRVSGPSEYRTLLAPIADEYEQWIVEKLESKVGGLDPEFQKAAMTQIKECREALGRIRRGIEIISTDKNAADAFSFANRAMWLQMSHGNWARKNSDMGKVDTPKPQEYKGEWRLFQLAFFLMNIESITDASSRDRITADLLWFATGGGKTEAYLGLIAFTIAHRRLRHDNNMRYGTAVMMRYTLRLLTIQQFHRAATLMCGCEYLRRKNPEKWGDEPFLVGLWVGSGTTPNKLSGEYGAQKAIASAKQGNPPHEHSPLQVLSCPWCGKTINEYCYEVSGTPKQCRIYCPNKTCAFSKKMDGDMGLPVLVVDEDIYKRCPSLIIGTVDKFAQIAWKWETGAIFGRVNRRCEKHGFVVSGLESACNSNHARYKQSDIESMLEPPELIIQDELHLISGPLGTLTGHYETAVDLLCANSDGIRPKIIASTATTRRADEQIRNLFNRGTSRIFPPQGIDFGESFFAQEVPLDKEPGKTYVGVCTTARSRLTVLGRISAVLLRCVRRMEEDMPDNGLSYDAIDPYYTLVSYFNTLRELGGASKMYDDTVPGYIQRLFNNFEDRDDKKGRYKNQNLEKVELTSRVTSDKIPDTIKRLERRLGGTIRPEDLLLCTNMLSVGVDILRLGVMIVNGQPKDHSEYIQATGRVGRVRPGLVVVSYNPLKPRDLSHYENFGYYHSTLHKNVESANLTPFAPRARDRALFGILVALVRILDSRLAKNDTAGKFDKDVRHVSKVLDAMRKDLSGRVGNIDLQEKDATLKELEHCIRQWHAWALELDKLQYKGNEHEMAKRPEDVYYLLKSTYHDDDGGLVPVPNSLRDAEESVKMWYLDDSPKFELDAPENDTQ